MSNRIALLILCCFVVWGCSSTNSGPSAEGTAFLLESEPPEPRGVVALKTALTAEQPPADDVVIIGRVGGGQGDTFAENEASFLLRDMDLKISSHDHEGNHDNCKFCQAEKAKELESMVLVRIVDAEGNVVATNAQQLLGLRENHVVLAQGTGTVDEVGTFVFDAAKIYIRE